METLTQNAALHTDIVQQLGPWPLAHCLAQGLREHILSSNFSSNTQGLAQPGEEEGRGNGAQVTRTTPQLSWGHLPVDEPDDRTLIIGTNHLYHITHAAPDGVGLGGRVSSWPCPQQSVNEGIREPEAAAAGQVVTWQA